MNNPLSLIDPSGYSWLSKLFSGIGHFLHKFWRPLLAIVVAWIAWPYIAGLISSNISAAAISSSFAATGSTAIAVQAGAAMAAAAAQWISVVAGAAAGAISGAIVGGFKDALIGGLTGGLLTESGFLWGQVGNKAFEA